MRFHTKAATRRLPGPARPTVAGGQAAHPTRPLLLPPGSLPFLSIRRRRVPPQLLMGMARIRRHQKIRVSQVTSIKVLTLSAMQQFQVPTTTDTWLWYVS